MIITWIVIIQLSLYHYCCVMDYYHYYQLSTINYHWIMSPPKPPHPDPSGVPWLIASVLLCLGEPQSAGQQGRADGHRLVQLEVRSTMEKADGTIQNGDFMGFEGDFNGI